MIDWSTVANLPPDPALFYYRNLRKAARLHPTTDIMQASFHSSGLVSLRPSRRSGAPAARSSSLAVFARGGSPAPKRQGVVHHVQGLWEVKHRAVQALKYVIQITPSDMTLTPAAEI